MTTHTTQVEFFLANAVDGQLSDAQMADMLMLPEGDTVFTDSVDAPKSTTVDTTQTTSGEADTNVKAQDAGDDKAGAASDSEPIILAKDGKHTIPYAKLVEARDAERHWKAQAEQMQTQLADLQAQAQARAESGQAPTQTDKAVQAATDAIAAGNADLSLFGDFSEEAIAKGVSALVAQQVQAAMGQVQQLVKPIQDQAVLSAKDLHFKTIYDAHPDADSMAESKELADWIDKQPSFARNAYQSVLTQGTAEQVVEMLTTFKDATGNAVQGIGQVQALAAAAKAKVAKAVAAVPASLSDFPGASVQTTDPDEALLNMSAEQLIDKFAGKSPDQINAMLARLV